MFIQVRFDESKTFLSGLSQSGLRLKEQVSFWAPLVMHDIRTKEIQKGKIMNSEELSKELEQHEQKISSFKSQMDNLYREIQDAMPNAAASWMNKEVEGIIKENPEFVQTLGIGRLKELKFKLITLIEYLPEIVAEEFLDSGRWPHHTEFQDRSFSTSQQRKSHLNLVFRNIISSLGSLLDEFGLIREQKGSIQSWIRTDAKSFSYAKDPSSDNLPNTKIKAYWNLFDEYTSLIQKKNDICKAIEAAKAKELWDEA